MQVFLSIKAKLQNMSCILPVRFENEAKLHNNIKISIMLLERTLSLKC